MRLVALRVTIAGAKDGTAHQGEDREDRRFLTAKSRKHASKGFSRPNAKIRRAPIISATANTSSANPKFGRSQK